MRIHLVRAAACASLVALPILVSTQDAISPHARELHERAIVVDSHDDTTQRLFFDKTFDIARRNANGNIASCCSASRRLIDPCVVLFSMVFMPSVICKMRLCNPR